MEGYKGFEDAENFDDLLNLEDDFEEEDNESEQEELFKQNPLRAIWIKLTELDEKMDVIIQEINEEDQNVS